MQPIKLYGNHGPNPPKIAVLLAELDLPHEIQPLSMEEVKQAPFLAINPNGRMPAIHDPNTNFTVWESGAIIEYLLETYDKEHRLSFEHGTAEYWQARQLLFFQVSGQAPYYGQAAWFSKFHKEKLESAVERYAAEVNRVSGVIEGLLKEQAEKYGGNEVWLVGNRISYADLAFVTWQTLIRLIVLSKEQYDEDKYPYLKKWLGTMLARENVRKPLTNSGFPL